MSKTNSGFYFAPDRVAKRQTARSLISKPAKTLNTPRNLRMASNNDIHIGPNHTSKYITNAFVKCQKSCEEFTDLSISTDKELCAVLSNVLRLYQISTKNEENLIAYNKLIRDAGIKITKNTINPLLPALKAIFKNTNKSNLGRYGAALHLANLEGVKPDRFAQFVTEEGGLVKCAREGAARLNPDREAEKEKRVEAIIAALREAGIPFKSPQLSKDLPLGFSVALISKAADGSLTLLGHRVEKEATVTRFKPMV